MKKNAIYIIIGVIVVFTFNSRLFAQEKLGQTGMQFLSVISDAKASAMAGAVTSVETNSSALFFNPATMGFNEDFVSASFSQNKWIAGTKTKEELAASLLKLIKERSNGTMS